MLSSSVKFALLAWLACVNGAEWSIDSTTSATTLVGVGAASDDLAIAAAAMNGIGALNEQYDGSAWSKNRVQGGLLMDTAVSKAGVSVSVSMWPVFVSTDNGETYSNTTLNGLSQNANMFGANKDKMGLVGSWASKKTDGTPGFDSTSGVAVSDDQGATWTLSAEVPNGSVRYGAFPSEETWYISSGMWASDDASVDAARVHQIGSRIHVDKLDGKMTVKQEARPKTTKKSNEDATGYWGSVAKTTDGGKTWTKVFQTDPLGYVYFNGIACATDDNCVVVGEGSDADGNYLTVAYTTVDGGSTWTQTHSAGDVSMMAATAVGANEFWIAGTAKNGRQLAGQFYHSTDGGLSWTLEQSMDDCFALDLDFGDKVGFAACSSSSGTSCFVAVYK